MRVAVCCKDVPFNMITDSVKISGGEVKVESSAFNINEFDAYALEEAVSLKESAGNKTQIEITALSLGPLRIQEVLQLALAKGVDHVLRIDAETSRPELVAAYLVRALRKIDPQIVMVGVQSEDWMGGEVGVYLAQALNFGLAFAVTEISQVTDKYVQVKKEIGGGKIAEVVTRIPVVLCVQSGIRPLRYLSTLRMKKVRKIPIQVWRDLNVEEFKTKIPSIGAYKAKEISLPSTKTHAEMITGDRSEVVLRVLKIIDNVP